MGIGGVNGINLVVNKPDLLDRAIVYGPLERLQPQHRLEETEINQRFEQMRPYLLGAMFDALSVAMREKDHIKFSELPRLADYARWGCASAIALGCTTKQYWDALTANIQTQNLEALDASPIAQALQIFMADKSEWDGTPSKLLNKLNAIAEKEKIDTKAKQWPKDAGWLTRRMNLVLPNLADAGITYVVKHDGKSRHVELRNARFDVSAVNGVQDV